MSSRKLLFHLQLQLLLALLVYTSSLSQVRWDGEAGDGQWTTTRNWAGNILPGITDNVILDNSFITGSYTVTLPSGNNLVQIRSITITPGPDNKIDLILPTTNVATPAFKVSGAVYGMVIANGGTFKNASGAKNGIPVEIADSLKINNGGRYLQNSSSSHASVVTVLSKAAGTEEGCFEFDIPAASSTVSLSNRTYGKLIFSSNAMNGTVTYTASGTNAVMIKSDLQLGSGVMLSLNFSDTLYIGRDLLQQGGTLNLGNAARTLVTVVNRHLVQAATGSIAETGTGFPELLFGGNVNQQINCKGIIKDSVAIIINNMAGATLAAPWSLPYKLNLVNGKVTTSVVNILRLQAGCRILVDSTTNNSFIDGPLRKEGLLNAAHFLFPVGKGSSLQWLELKNASGNFMVEFFDNNPQLTPGSLGPGISQLSPNGYWTIKADASPLPAASVELSFNALNIGIGPDLSTARVSKLLNGVWMNYGNSAATGSVGIRGSIVSGPVASWSLVADTFALGNSVPANGPLALSNDMVPPNRNIRAVNGGLPQLVAVTDQTLIYRAFEKMQTKFFIVDNTGRIIKIMNTVIEKGINRLALELPFLPAGIYSIQAFTPKGQSNSLRFVFLR